MSSVGILITSRNNYKFTDQYWVPNIKNNRNIDEFTILNIDEDSSVAEKKIGRKMCRDHNMVYMDRENRGIHSNLLTAANYFEPRGVKFIIWFQTDAWPVQKNFFNSLGSLVSSGRLDEFGTIGFNGIDTSRMGMDLYEKMIKKVNNGRRPVCVVARSSLEKGDPWTCGIKAPKCKHPLKDPDKFKKPFAVSINNWFGSAINIKLFRKYIDTSHGFHFFHGWDDICLQFCQNNIYNLVLPSYYVSHNQELKRKVKLPPKSIRLAYKGDDTFHSLVGFTSKEWKQQWGYEYDNRKTFKDVRKRYKGTHIYDFFHLDLNKGPLKSFDIPESEYSE